MSTGTRLVPEPVDPDALPATLDPVKAREMQAKAVKSHSAKRREAQQNRIHAAKTALEPAVEGAQAAMASKRLDGKTNEELADSIIKRMAKVVLLGGEAFLPTTLAEVNETAKSWSMIAKAESVRKGKVKDDVPEDDTMAEQVVKQMSKLARHLTAVHERSAAGS